jgi:paraquat-inducible protein B
MNDPVDAADQPRRNNAAAQKSWWARWIWGVPIAAVGIAVWLLVRDRGIDATVVFDEAAGMDGGTKVVQRRIKVGTVRHVELATDGWHVIAQLNLDKSVEQFLRSGTRFYLEGAHPSLTNLASLKAIVRGPNIVLVAGPGGAARHFKGSMGPRHGALGETAAELCLRSCGFPIAAPVTWQQVENGTRPNAFTARTPLYAWG